MQFLKRKNILYKSKFTLIIISMMVASCGKKSNESDTMTKFCIPDSLAKIITIDTVKSEKVISDLKLPGKSTFNEDNVVKVFPLVSGHVMDVKVSLGDYVEKGQLLAVLQSSDMANYYNDFKAAQSDLAITKENLDVTNDLYRSGLRSQKDLVLAQNEYYRALAQYNKVKEVMKIYGGAVQSIDSFGSRYSIKSPISGFIVEKNINSGMELRSDDADNVFTISDLKEVWAVANVYETDISKIEIGSIAEIVAISYPERKFFGKVERISNMLNPETNVMTVKIRLNNADYALKPGMFANFSILFPENKKMMVLHKDPVLFDENKNYVLLYKDKCDVSMQQIKIVNTFSNNIYFESKTLKPGDLVISKNGLFIFTALKKL